MSKSGMNKASYIKNQLTLGLARLGNQGFYAGVTNKRIIVLPIKRMTGKVDNENVFPVDFKDVEVKGNKLLIVIPDTGKLLKLTFGFGIGLKHYLAWTRTNSLNQYTKESNLKRYRKTARNHEETSFSTNSHNNLDL